MLGYELDSRAPARAAVTRDGREPAARARGVCGRLVDGVTLEIGSSEIVGVTGLMGSGFEELPYLLGGAHPAQAGELTVGGRRIDLATACPRDLVDAGVALVPERRDAQGLSLSMSLLENVTLPRVRVHGSPGRLGFGWQREEADWVIRELGVRPPAPGMTVGNLSGGNQQKVMLGKWLRGDPRLLVLHEPTRAVDVAARRDLMAVNFRVATSGSGVLVAGMDANELQSMCDRVEEELRGVAVTVEGVVNAVYRNHSNGHAAVREGVA